MALSDYELQVLAQMEAQLSDQDPKLAYKMRDNSTPQNPLPSKPRKVALGVVLLLIGITTLVTGLVLTPQLPDFVGAGIGVSGFILMVVGMLTIFGVFFSRKTSNSPKLSRKPAAKTRDGFMHRQEQKWEDRHPGH